MREVVLVVQFAKPVIDLLEAGAFAERVRAEFPIREERPAPPAMEERFERDAAVASFKLEIVERPPTTRFWFLSEDRSRLIQLQNDLFAFNWRKISEEDDYPRYAYMRDSAERYLGILTDVVGAEGRGAMEPNWVEVSFINHVEAPEGHSGLGTIAATVRDSTGDAFLPKREEAELRERFLIVEGDTPIGRLHFSVSPAFRTSDGESIWIVTLTARIKATGEGLQSAFARLDLAHEWVVRAFDELTTESMHAVWGKEAVAG